MRLGEVRWEAVSVACVSPLRSNLSRVFVSFAHFSSDVQLEDQMNMVIFDVDAPDNAEEQETWNHESKRGAEDVVGESGARLLHTGTEGDFRENSE